MIELNGTIIAVILNFIILVWILEYFLYKPVKDVLDQRRKTVETNIADSQEKLRQAGELKELYESELASVSKKGEEIIKNATDSADTIRTHALETAKLDAAFIRSEAEKEAENLKTEAFGNAKKDIAALVCAVSSRFLKKTINEESNRPMVEELVRQVEGADLN